MVPIVTTWMYLGFVRRAGMIDVDLSSVQLSLERQQVLAQVVPEACGACQISPVKGSSIRGS